MSEMHEGLGVIGMGIMGGAMAKTCGRRVIRFADMTRGLKRTNGLGRLELRHYLRRAKSLRRAK
jgi:3-hydroxyisobutyrate dehydrogenase-like beta-hydroxyacid dehydrogenase